MVELYVVYRMAVQCQVECDLACLSDFDLLGMVACRVVLSRIASDVGAASLFKCVGNLSRKERGGVFDDDMSVAICLTRELLKGIEHGIVCSVDVEMVGVGSGDDGNMRMQL